jgi:hypothetical protein
MDVNKLLDTIQRGLNDIENEILENLDAKAKNQRTKPTEVRLRELECLVARLRWDVSSIKGSVSLYEMRLESARKDAMQALEEVRKLSAAGARQKRR